MSDIVNYWGFLTACILLNLTPGSDTIYILTRTIAEGKKSGLMSSFGILAGILCHILAVSLGLAGIVAHSPTLFNFLKYAGAIYLCYLGIKMWRAVGVRENQSRQTSSMEDIPSRVDYQSIKPESIALFLGVIAAVCIQ